MSISGLSVAVVDLGKGHRSSSRLFFPFAAHMGDHNHFNMTIAGYVFSSLTFYQFYELFLQIVDMYRSNGHPLGQLIRMWNLRKKFQAAWLDFITLQQIDYKHGFSCVCQGRTDDDRLRRPCRRVVVDGITVGYNPALAYLVAPWATAVPPGAPAPELRAGSAYKQRIVIANKDVRRMLQRFTIPYMSQVRDKGLEPAEHDNLSAKLQLSHPWIVPYLTFFQHVGRRYCVPELYPILRALASTASASSLLPFEVRFMMRTTWVFKVVRVVLMIMFPLLCTFMAHYICTLCLFTFYM
jgi:hypothetical protein